MQKNRFVRMHVAGLDGALPCSGLTPSSVAHDWPRNTDSGKTSAEISDSVSFGLLHSRMSRQGCQ